MTVVPLLAVGIVLNLVAVLFILISVVLILVVLIQKGRGGGLSAAFGGGMASGLLGSKTGDFLTWATITLVAVYLVLAVLLDKFYKPTITAYNIGQTTNAPQPAPQEKAPAPRPSGTSTSGTPSAPATQPPAGAGQTQPPAGTSPGAGTGTAAEPNAAGG
jgi:preprotein translocase subunit SecG